MTDDAELYAHEIAAIKSMKGQSELHIITILQDLSDKSALDVVGIDVDTHTALSMAKPPKEVITDVHIKLEMP